MDPVNIRVGSIHGFNIETIVIRKLDLHGPLDSDEVIQARDELLRMDHVIINLDSLEMRMHPERMFEVIRFCFDFRLRLHVFGDVQAFLLALKEVVRKQTPLVTSAHDLVDELFPNGVWMFNSVQREDQTEQISK